MLENCDFLWSGGGEEVGVNCSFKYQSVHIKDDPGTKVQHCTSSGDAAGVPLMKMMMMMRLRLKLHTRDRKQKMNV